MSLIKFDKLPEFTNNQPLCDHPFYSVLMGQDTRPGGFEEIENYLDSLGFIKGTHKITEEELKILEYVLEIASRFWTPSQTVYSFSDCFSLHNGSQNLYNNDGGYYVSCKTVNHKENKLFNPTPLLLGFITTMAPIYEMAPINYHFEVAGGYLFIKYSKIIGHRRLCKVDFD